MWLTWAGKEFRKSISWKPDSWMVKAACRITECKDLWDSFSRASSQTSTFPSAVMGCSNSIVSPSRDETAKIRSYTWRHYFKDVTDLCCWAEFKKIICVEKLALSWNLTLLMLSKMLRRWAWMVWESEAWPRISSRAGSETKKKRGNCRRFFSK